MFRANCSEYFPIFISVLWTSGLFFSQGDQTAESLSHSLNLKLLTVKVCVSQVCLQSAVSSTCTLVCVTFVDIHSRHGNGRKRRLFVALTSTVHCMTLVKYFKEVSTLYTSSTSRYKLYFRTLSGNFSYFVDSI